VDARVREEGEGSSVVKKMKKRLEDKGDGKRMKTIKGDQGSELCAV
jgi:hypothetical protein